MKMTYPGIVLLVGVGVGLATFLYYMFTDNNRENGHQQSNSRNGRTSDHYNHWISSPQESVLNRRSSSNSSITKEERDLTSKDDINNCSICQYALLGSNIIQLNPCKHNFHQDCINGWRRYDSRASCPNCRRQIK